MSPSRDRMARRGPSSFEWPPVWRAAVRGAADQIRLLASSGADPDVFGDQGTTPLHVAAIYGHANAVEALLGIGADPNRVDGHGNGPLWAAVHEACLARRTDQNLTIVRLLLTGGADRDHRNRYGLSPRDLAQKRDATVAALFPGQGDPA